MYQNQTESKVVQVSQKISYMEKKVEIEKKFQENPQTCHIFQVFQQLFKGYTFSSLF